MCAICSVLTIMEQQLFYAMFPLLSNLAILKEIVSNMIAEDDDVELESILSFPGQDDKFCWSQFLFFKMTPVICHFFMTIHLTYS